MADLDDLLLKTSRTFALAIPLLPEPTRREVSVAYLLFRIADTFEDATDWPRQQRLEALERLVDVLDTPPPARDVDARALVEWALRTPPVSHAGYLELLQQTAEVLAEVDHMTPTARAIILNHAKRTTEGMAQVVARADERGNLQLRSLQDLKDYCYIVAGIVGELLTELFLHDCPELRHSTAALTTEMKAFGEGLQLVNILKDAGDDAKDGRVYLPKTVPREEVMALAREDLAASNRYVQALQKGGAPRGFLAFTGLSLVLAFKALEALDEKGTGAKVSREVVGRAFSALEQALDLHAPLDLRQLAHEA